MTFFTKADCELCRSALYVIERVRRRIPFDLEIVDITAAGNEKWFALYRDDIPVVHLNGQKILQHRVEEGRLRASVAGP